ncbi:MAG: hypothetical protein FD181_233 [Prolixibacteraceae bacterium]|nr:MAG: hypothetical protein FD181_233 [Prolixibacteraceae bacterium]
MKISWAITFLFVLFVNQVISQNDIIKSNQKLLSKIKQSSGLGALWDFSEKEGHTRKAIGLGKFPLKEQNGILPRINDGSLSGYSAQFGNKAFLSLENSKTGELNIYGEGQAVTVIAWVKWEGNTGFAGGMWNEYQDGGKRQYGLFV